MRRKREVYLSAFVSEETRLQGKALNLQAKGITTLDEISPFLCSETESLNLHGNKLTTLKNIEQFNFLRELDISSNKISSCSELTRLKDMYQLKKLYVSNNPFLNEPLDENILDFILERETDIEILSFELLNTIKEVGEEEMKIIFLKNYLNKIEIHEELKQKEYVRQTRPKVKTQALLDKIIPQFYTIIEDPRMAHAIKKEALDIKRKKNATMESALESTKNNKVTKINQLIGDIVGLLHDNQSFRQSRNFLLEVNFNDNTISFSPERNKDFNNTIKMDEDQFSPVKYIELSKDENTFEEFTLTNTRNLKQTISAMKEKQASHQESFNYDVIQTSRKPSASPNNPSKSPLNNKLKHFSDFKQNYQTELKKIKERKEMESKKSNQSSVRKVEPALPSKSVTPIKYKQSTKNKTPGDTARSQYIKVIEQNEQESNSLPKQSQQFTKSPMVSPKNFQQSSISMRTALYNNGESITPEVIETIYFKSLSKTNPMFSLLFSPANSLNNEEKNTILDALKIDHKEKFIELFKEKISNQNLMRQLEQTRQQLGSKLEEAVDNNRGVFVQNERLKEEFAWIDDKHKTLQTQYNKIYNRLKQSEARQKNKATAMIIMQTSYKKIKDSYKDKADQLTLLTQSEDTEETIRQKHEKLLKMIYLRKLKEKAAKWKPILAQIAKSKIKLEKELKEIGVEAFASNRTYCKSIKAYSNKYDRISLQKHFTLWATEKQNEKKYKGLNKYLRQRESKDFISLLKKNEANSKMKKLKQIWADRYFKQKRYTASFDKLKNNRSQAKINQQNAVNFHKAKVLNRYVSAIRYLIATRKRHIEVISQKHINLRVKSQFKRMVNIMKKDHFQLLEKSHKARLLHQKYQKNHGLARLRIEGSFLKQEKQKRKDLVKYLKKKNLKFMRKSHKKTLKLLKKLKKASISLKSGMIAMYLNRQKKSNDYNKVLINTKLQKFCFNLKNLRTTRFATRDKQRKLQTFLQHKLQMNKMKLLRNLQIGRLKGKNYIKHRTIQEMNTQMDLNDQTAMDIVRTSKEEMLRLQRDIHFLKQQIQTQSLREMVLMREKDEIMLNIGESCEVMEQMKREIAKLSAEYALQLQRYDELAVKYNNALTLLEKKQLDCEWLYDSLRDHKLP